jgi:hypothetical protein
MTMKERDKGILVPTSGAIEELIVVPTLACVARFHREGFRQVLPVKAQKFQKVLRQLAGRKARCVLPNTDAKMAVVRRYAY